MKMPIFVFMTAYGSIDTAVKAMKSGAREYVNKPFFQEIFAIIDIIRDKLGQENELRLIKRQQRERITLDNIIDHSAAMKERCRWRRRSQGSAPQRCCSPGRAGPAKTCLLGPSTMQATAAKAFCDHQLRLTHRDTFLRANFRTRTGRLHRRPKLRKGCSKWRKEARYSLTRSARSSCHAVRLLGVIENRTIRRVGVPPTSLLTSGS